MGPYKALPLRVRSDMGITAIKRYSTFSKVVGLERYHKMVWCYIQYIHCGVRSYSSVEMQLVYSTAPTWFRRMCERVCVCVCVCECVCVFVSMREKMKEREKEKECVCVCERERERERGRVCKY